MLNSNVWCTCAGGGRTYRYVANNSDTLFSFGSGLSYTTFELQHKSLVSCRNALKFEFLLCTVLVSAPALPLLLI